MGKDKPKPEAEEVPEPEDLEETLEEEEQPKKKKSKKVVSEELDPERFYK